MSILNMHKLGLQPVEDSIATLIHYLEKVRSNFKKIDVSELTDIKKKYSKLTVGIVIQESEEEILFDMFGKIKNKLIPLLEAEQKKLSISDGYHQPLHAFRENVASVNPYDYLNDLPRDLHFMGRRVLKILFDYQINKNSRNKPKYPQYKGYLDRFSYFNIYMYGFFYRNRELKEDFKMFLWDYADNLNKILGDWRQLLNIKIDLDEDIKKIRSETDALFESYLNKLNERFPLHKFQGHVFTRLLENNLTNFRSSLEQYIEKSKTHIERFEKKSEIPKPKKPWLHKTKKYQKELMEWEEEIGTGRVNYDILVLDYVVHYIKLKELRRQWNQLREYISELIGSDAELAKFHL